jgi:predicted RND superfamily exporter protein
MLRREEGHLLETSTARAVIYSAVTTIASFGSLAFASHRGMASLGQLLTLGVVFTTLCNLLLLPALIELQVRRRQTPPSRSSAEVALDL